MFEICWRSLRETEKKFEKRMSICTYSTTLTPTSNNNQITNASEFELVTRLVVMNAFYFLSWVDLASNSITEVPDLSPFPIVSLYLHDNKIANTASVQNLKSMKYLQNLTLFGNPIQ